MLFILIYYIFLFFCANKFLNIYILLLCENKINGLLYFYDYLVNLNLFLWISIGKAGGSFTNFSNVSFSWFLFHVCVSEWLLTKQGWVFQHLFCSSDGCCKPGMYAFWICPLWIIILFLTVGPLFPLHKRFNKFFLWWHESIMQLISFNYN